MHCKVCGVSGDGEAELRSILDQSDDRWLKFDDVYFVCQKNDWPLPSSLPDGVTLNFRHLFADVDPDSLYLVTQRGSDFHKHNSDATVLFDRGRHLIVSISEETVKQMAAEVPTLGFDPITDNMSVVESCPVPKKPVRNSDVAQVVDAVSRVSIRGYLTTLASYPTRRSVTRYYREAAKWAEKLFQGMDYETELMDFRMPGSDRGPEGRCHNVIARKNSMKSADQRIVLVVAHLDSINDEEPAHLVDALAPGADDNASGSAGVLEIARVFRNVVIEHELRFVLVGGEERNLIGSTTYVSRLSSDETSRIDAVINMDMIGSLNPGVAARGVLLESKPFAQQEINDLAAAAHSYAELKVATSLNPFASDHVSFLKEGIPAVLTIEGSDGSNPHYHSADDQIDQIDVELAYNIIRMNTAFVAERVGLAGQADRTSR